MNIHIEKAISIFGTQENLAEALNSTRTLKDQKNKVRQGHVWQWLHEYNGKQPNAKNALAIEEATAGAVSRFDLRPDIFGEDAA